MKVIVAPSILAVKPENMDSVLLQLEKSSCEWIHIDCMDGQFVEQSSFKTCDVVDVKSKTTKILDVHLMINNPQDFILDYIEAGSDLISFHIEAVKNQSEALKIIKLVQKNNIDCGIALNPSTPVSAIYDFLSEVDFVVVMSVYPGLGGQKFDFNVVEKVRELNSIRIKQNLKFKIEIDGGINSETSKIAVDAGCDVLVAGTFITSSPDIEGAIEQLRDK